MFTQKTNDVRESSCDAMDGCHIFMVSGNPVSLPSLRDKSLSLEEDKENQLSWVVVGRRRFVGGEISVDGKNELQHPMIVQKEIVNSFFLGGFVMLGHHLQRGWSTSLKRYLTGRKDRRRQQKTLSMRRTGPSASASSSSALSSLSASSSF